MKKLFFSFLLLVCACSISAQTFKYGDLYYYVTNTTNKTVRVTQHNDHKLLVNVTVPASVEYNGASYSVTEIGNSAFSNCGALQSLTLPNSVTSIGSYAFQSCSALQSISLPDGLTSIGNDAFEYCDALASVTLPYSITSIGSWAFYGAGIKSIIITANNVQQYLNSSINSQLLNAHLAASAERHLVVGGAEVTHHLVIPDGTTKSKIMLSITSNLLILFQYLIRLLPSVSKLLSVSHTCI